MRKLLPVLLALVGIGGGLGAGVLLKPATVADPAQAETCVPPAMDPRAETASAAVPDHAAPRDQGDGSVRDYIKLNNQFVIPVIGDERIASLVVLALSLEIDAGTSDVVYQREPKIRDSFLQVLFDHANVGGFEGGFTESHKLGPLRRALLKAAQDSVGDVVTDVLITEIAKQDA